MLATYIQHICAFIQLYGVLVSDSYQLSSHLKVAYLTHNTKHYHCLANPTVILSSYFYTNINIVWQEHHFHSFNKCIVFNFISCEELKFSCDFLRRYQTQREIIMVLMTRNVVLNDRKVFFFIRSSLLRWIVNW